MVPYVNTALQCRKPMYLGFSEVRSDHLMAQTDTNIPSQYSILRSYVFRKAQLYSALK